METVTVTETVTFAAGTDITIDASANGGVVTDVIDGAVIRVEGIDVDIRLVSIQTPKLPLGRPGFRPWPPFVGSTKIQL